MKVLFVCDSLGSGGAQKLLVDLALSLNCSIESTFVILEKASDRYSKILSDHGIKTIFIADHMKSHLYNVKFIKDIIRLGNYDVVHANLFPSTYYVALIKALIGKKSPPIIMTEHSTDNRRRHIKAFLPIEKYVYDKYDHIISISEQTQNELLNWINPSTDKKFTVIENGIKLDDYRMAKPYDRKTFIEGIADSDVLIGLIGSFTPQKNHSKMLEALNLLPPNYKLIFVGEGPLKSEIVKIAETKQLQHRVFFLGYRQDVGRIMKTLDIIVVPSLWEGFGLVAVEALAAGTPVAASNVIGLSDIVSKYGLLFDPNDPKSIANSMILTLEDGDTEKRVREGTLYAEKYSIEQMRDRYVALFSSVLDK